jgi:hypothetical protein
MNNLSNTAPEQIIGNNSKNFFYEKVKENLTNEKVNVVSYIDDPTIVEANKKQFEIICSIAYLFGMDFCSQQYIKKDIWKRVEARLNENNINRETFELFLNFIFYKENMGDVFISTKNSMNNEVSSEIMFENSSEKMIFNQLRGFVKSVINNSYLPVNLVMNIDNILSKHDKYTYIDILSINNYIVKDCLYKGNYAIKNYIKLYSNPYWTELLNTAIKKFDNQKFALMYMDSFVSLMETIKRMDLNKEIFIELFENSFDFDLVFANVIEIKSEETSEELSEKTIENTYKPLSSEALSDLINNNENVAFIDNALLDINKNIFTSDADVIKTIESITEDMENSDFMQNVYTFLANSLQKLNVEKLFDKNRKLTYNFSYDIAKVSDLLKDKLTEIQADYKLKLEFICKDIPEEKLQKVTNLINICIGELYIEDEDHKKYFISQIIESSIKTWFNFQQMMTLIETSKISGADMLSYVSLNKYINNDDNILEIFNVANKVGQIELKMRFIQLFSTWFDKLNQEINAYADGIDEKSIKQPKKKTGKKDEKINN